MPDVDSHTCVPACLTPCGLLWLLLHLCTWAVCSGLRAVSPPLWCSPGSPPAQAGSGAPDFSSTLHTCLQHPQRSLEGSVSAAAVASSRAVSRQISISCRTNQALRVLVGLYETLYPQFLEQLLLESARSKSLLDGSMSILLPRLIGRYIYSLLFFLMHVSLGS